MQRKWTGAALLLTVAWTSGCGSAEAPVGEPQSAVTTVTKITDAGPDKAVFEFLEAIRTGDEQKAGNMMTPLARQKTSEMSLVVAPPGSTTASFKVNAVELIDDGAHVSSHWTDIDDEGQTQSSEYIWVLRKEAEGWRIAGMATKVFADELPVILNFEDPEDMIRKQELIEAEIERRSQTETASAADDAKADKTEKR